MTDQYRDDDVSDLRKFLGETSVPYQQLMSASMALKRRQIIGGQATGKATVEMLRVVLGSGKYYNADELMRATRAVGKELSSSAPSEVTIGNVVRRVLLLIREEFAAKVMGSTEHGSSDDEGDNNAAGGTNTNNRRRRESRGGSLDLTQPAVVENTSYSRVMESAAAAAGSGSGSGSSPRSASGKSDGENSSSSSSIIDSKTKLSLGSVLGAFSFHDSTATHTRLGGGVGKGGDGGATVNLGGLEIQDFSTPMPTLRQAIMGGINELNDEIENVLGPICEQSMEQIHADACVLVYGWSQVAESFLKAAARKRKFQIIIVEAGPDLSGHRLAEALKDTPNVSCTLIPDCAVYAIMGRVNTALIAPDAVTADGGAICKAGHLIMATVAKEHHVPVVGLASTFLLTPQFAHSSHEGLGQLLSPSMIMQYNANICQENVEVVNPAYEFLPPAVMDLYVTNNGSHQPSYIYRLLSEYYCPADHVL
jgi:translation initiation factor eIF-2B subunit beta